MGKSPKEVILNNTREHLTAVILAAGLGTRMGCAQTKQNIPILGESVLLRSVGAFAGCRAVKSIVVVARCEEISEVTEALKGISPKLYAVVLGGECRQESARRGFLALPDEATHIAIHDAARCLVTPEMIERVYKSALVFGAATAGTRVTDTVKKMKADMTVDETLPRESLFLAGTPQIFERGLYERALQSFSGRLSKLTDDNMLIERLGAGVKCVDTGRENIKITTAEDISLAEYILEKRKCTNTE